MSVNYKISSHNSRTSALILILIFDFDFVSFDFDYVSFDFDYVSFDFDYVSFDFDFVSFDSDFVKEIPIFQLQILLQCMSLKRCHHSEHFVSMCL